MESDLSPDSTRLDFKEYISDLTLENPPEFRELTKLATRVVIELEEDFDLETKSVGSTDQEKKSNPENPYHDLMTVYLPKIAGTAAEKLKIDLVFDSDFMLGLLAHENYMRQLFKPNQKLLSFHVGIGQRTFCSTIALLHKTTADWNFFGCDKIRGDSHIFLNGPQKTINVFDSKSIKILEKQIIERFGIRPFGLFTFDIKHSDIVSTVQAIRLMLICLARKGMAIIRLPDLIDLSKNAAFSQQYDYVFYLLNTMFDKVEVLSCPWTRKFYLICSIYAKYTEQFMRHFDFLYEEFTKSPRFVPRILSGAEEKLQAPKWVAEISQKSAQPVVLNKTTELAILDLFD